MPDETPHTASHDDEPGHLRAQVERLADAASHFADAAAQLAPPVPMLRGMSHLVAFFVAVVAGAWLVWHAVHPLQAVAGGVYAVGLTLALGASAAYHRIRWAPDAHRRMRTVDHSMIFVLVGCTYTPLLLVTFHGLPRILTLAGIWLAAAVGIALRVAVRDPSRALLTGTYLALGWMSVLLLPAVEHRVDAQVFALLVIGGALYSVGAIVYLLQRPNPLPRIFGFHEVFHALVIAAAACHYGALYGLVSGRVGA